MCYDSSVTTKKISDYLHEHGNDSALAIDPYHGMTPLHILSMNPHAPPDAIAALFNSNIQTVFCSDNQQKNPLSAITEIRCFFLLNWTTQIMRMQLREGN